MDEDVENIQKDLPLFLEETSTKNEIIPRMTFQHRAQGYKVKMCN